MGNVDGEVQLHVGVGAEPTDVVAAGGEEFRNVGGRPLDSVFRPAGSGVSGVLGLVGRLPQSARLLGVGGVRPGGEDDLVGGGVLERRQCGAEIETKRLEVIPWARYCVRCQDAREQR